MKTMRVFIAESDRDVRISLQMLIDRESGMQVIGISVRSDGLLGQVKAAQPDIVLLDWQLVPSTPGDIIENLHTLASQPHVIVLHIHPETKQTAKAAGADYFVSKDGPPDHLCAILQKLKRKRIEETTTSEGDEA